MRGTEKCLNDVGLRKNQAIMALNQLSFGMCFQSGIQIFIKDDLKDSDCQVVGIKLIIFFYLKMIKIATRSLRITHQNKYTFIPPSCYKIESKPNPVINVVLGTDNSDVCNIQFRLFENVVPRTAQNFKRLLLGTANFQGRALSLINNRVHQWVPRGFIELGHLAEGNCSIFGPIFRDESFQLLHDRPGLLTSISEENTNNSRFAITLAPCPFMDYKHTIFGEVTAQSINNLRIIERLGKGILGLRIKRTEEIALQIESHDDHHHH